MKKALILGAGGFIGHHLSKRLKEANYYVKGADMHLPEFSAVQADEFVTGDLRDLSFCSSVFDQHYDRVYQLAADMGGAGYIFTGENDAGIMTNSVQINLNVLNIAKTQKPGILFFSSSACIYPAPAALGAESYSEASAYPAAPDSEYGWEKLFSERIYLSYARNYGLSVRIARLHNVFGPEGAWSGGKEKAIAAICRKVIQAPDGGHIQIWGDGSQTRSFLYIDECLEGMERLMASSYAQPVNIGSTEMVSIQALAQMIIDISGKNLSIENIKGPVGVDIRTSHNELISRELGWAPQMQLMEGLKKTYEWIASEMSKEARP